MKKVIFPIAAMLLILSNYINVNAAHQHSENCYVLQEHVHTGNEASGGGCYGEANFHVHSGDAASGGGCYGAVSGHVHSGNATTGGGCYGAANYHVHSGDSVNGGGCYGAANYHVHSGDATNGGGCYSVAKTETKTGSCTDTTSVSTGMATAFLDEYCSVCNQNRTVRRYYYDWVCPTTGTRTVSGSHKQCETCGTFLASEGTPGVGKTKTHNVTYNVTTYDLGCGKTEQSVEYYELNCGKTNATVESYSLNCGKTESTVEGYVLNCGKTTETVESYSLSCAYQDNANTGTLICTLGGNAYADLSETGIGKKYRSACFEDRIFMAGRGKQKRITNFYVLEGCEYEKNHLSNSGDAVDTK